jgi:hypothetical protein
MTENVLPESSIASWSGAGCYPRDGCTLHIVVYGLGDETISFDNVDDITLIMLDDKNGIKETDFKDKREL